MKRVSLNDRRWLMLRLALVGVAVAVYFATGGGLIYTMVGVGGLVLLFLVGPRMLVWKAQDGDETREHS